MTRFLVTPLLAIGLLHAADSEVDQAVLRLDVLAAKAPKPLAMEFRMRAAEAVRPRHPELARKLVDQTLAELRGGKDWVVGYGVVQGLAQASPAGALSVLPNLVPGYEQLVIGALVQSHQIDQAIALYLDLLKRGQTRVAGASSLIGPLSKQNPQRAAKLFSGLIAGLPDSPQPADAFWMVNTAATIAPFAPEAAASAMERVLKAAAAPDYGVNSMPTMIGAFAVGSKPLTTTSTRETLLLVAASRLRAIAPERLAAYKDALSAWDTSGAIQLKSVSYKSAVPAAAPGDSRALETAISRRMGQIRGMATDAERAELVRQIAADIGKLDPGQGKVNQIRSLANLSTEGDLGAETLAAVAGTLAAAMRDSYPGMFASKLVYPYGDGYIDLARLVRYERVPPPFEDPALDAAGALLEVREHVRQESGFTLAGLDGKQYSLAGLKGHVVLLNFWATWCSPCRKEMPDLEKLRKEYEGKGLTVLAVFDEDRETVEKFLAKTPYSFPVLLDAGRKANAAFMVDSVPQSFLFDREGRLVAQAMDMRTESQFRELLKRAGL